MPLSQGHIVLLCAIGLILLARPAHAFGAGNIGSTSKVEGQNWRHGDIEDVILALVSARAMNGKKFSKLDVKRIYFGNWLRDYSQAVDVGTVKYVSAEAIRILLWVLGFMSFGYGSGEFQVTTQRLGCYRPEEHIDNPKDYADNEDARQYDRRLRGPIDERRELAINPDTGLKNYIASERMGITTSAGLVRDLFSRSIQLGRSYARNKNKKDLYEALRLLGTGCHCLEDYAAHSNYVELALIEMGERDVFPHVGRRTAMQLRGARHEVYPIVTGTFGGVDFLHSVCGEFDDKTTQSEIQELQGTLQDAERNDGSVLQDLLNKVPSGIFGGTDQASKVNELQQNSQSHQMQNTRISPRQPEEWVRYLDDVQKQIYPIIEWHDQVMQSVTETIEKIPILPGLIDNIQEEINKFVFSLLAPYVVPIITQVKNELNTGSNEIIQSSVEKQHIVFRDDHSSDPTHSMLSKDHFSNILNEPAGKVASQTIKWVVPQIVAAWDDDRVDVNHTMDRIVHGVLHHPALRDQGEDGASEGRRLMFGVVEKWWREKSDREKDGLRRQLSRAGVESGRNHKEGVVDHGHGSGHLQMANLHQKQHDYPAGEAIDAIGNTINEITGGSNQGLPNRQSGQSGQGRRQGDLGVGKMAGEAVGGGLLGGIVGGIASAVAGDMLGGGLDENRQTKKRDSYGSGGKHTETITQTGQHGDRFGQAQYARTEDRHGGQSEQYTRYEQKPSAGGYQTRVDRQEYDDRGGYRQETQTYSSSSHGRHDNEYGSGGGHGRREETSSYASGGAYGRRDDESYGRSGGGHSRRDDESYGRSGGGHGRRDDDDTSGGYGRRQEHSSSGYGGGRDEHSSGGYGGRPERGEYSSSGFGGRQERDEYSGGYGGNQSSYGGRDEYGGGGGHGRQEQQYGGGHGRQEQSFGGGFGRNDDDEQRGSGFGGGFGGGYGHGQRRNDDNEYSRY